MERAVVVGRAGGDGDDQGGVRRGDEGEGQQFRRITEIRFLGRQWVADPLGGQGQGEAEFGNPGLERAWNSNPSMYKS